MSADTNLMPIPGPIDPVPVPRRASPRADGKVALVGLSKAQIREALEAAVRRQLMSDVPYGVLLSGGLDSSILVALLRRHTDELHTFSVGLEGSGDLDAARLVARHLGTTHHERVIAPEEIAEHLRAFAREGITHIQVTPRIQGVAGVEAFAPVLELLDRG
jgi:asparagine synthetase B (glutamine-hydrolysing)